MKFTKTDKITHGGSLIILFTTLFISLQLTVCEK